MRFKKRYKRRIRLLVIWGTWTAILLTGAGYLAIKLDVIRYTPTTKLSYVKNDTNNAITLTTPFDPKATTRAQARHANPPASAQQFIATPRALLTTLTQTHPQVVSHPLLPLPTTDVFFDDFEGNTLDTSKWRIAKRQWGGVGVNGGVIPQNVSVADGNLILEAHGDLYNGPLMGINKYGIPRRHGKRVGSAVATKHYFASGRYEVRAKIIPDLGVCSSFATMHYRELYPGQLGYKQAGGNGQDAYIDNHEIDIELPGRPRITAIYDVSYEYCLANTWRGQKRSELSDAYIHIGQPQNDGQYHTYRFDWHTGDHESQKPAKVEFYIDDKLIQTTTTNIPTLGSRFWVSAWFPFRWAGLPNFIESRMYVDWVRITPLGHADDQWVAESYADDGWAPYNEYPPHGQPERTAEVATPRLQQSKVIAQFDERDQEKPLGTGFNSFSAYASNANVGVTDQESHDNSGYALQVNYVKKVGRRHFCGVWIRLADKGQSLDTTGYRYLTFYVKGRRGHENFNVALADRAWTKEKDDAKLVGNIRDFLPNGVTRQWQKVHIPLDSALRLDFHQITQLALIFSFGRGEIFIDDIGLEG